MGSEEMIDLGIDPFELDGPISLETDPQAFFRHTTAPFASNILLNDEDVMSLAIQLHSQLDTEFELYLQVVSELFQAKKVFRKVIDTLQPTN